jgi:flavin-dependent dehydrogenase
VNYDALIIGGGPAGSVGGLLLARHGWRIAIVEQHTFPRDKVCGECLSHLGVETLRRAGLDERVLSQSPASLRYARLHAPDGTTSQVELDGEMWGISREVLDGLLLDAARQAGADVMQPARVEAIEPGRALVRDLRANQREPITARHILLADGKGALLPRRPRPTRDFGIKAHFTGLDAEPNAIGLYGVGRSYGGVAPVEGGWWNAAFSVPAEVLHASRGRLDNLFAQIQQANRSLDEQFRSAKRVSEWCASPLPRFAVVENWPAGVIPIGNAAAALEPIGGEGMGLAIRSAELAARALIASPTKPDLLALKLEYRRLWTVRRLACRTAALALSSPTLARPTVKLVANSERFAGVALRLMGKRATL